MIDGATAGAKPACARKEQSMTVTIYEGYDKSYIMLGSKDQRFVKAWGNVFKVPVSNLYKDLASVTSWANNELEEELLFEVE